MICKKCNQENDNNAKFCRFCGAALDENEQSASVNPQAPQSGAGQAPYGQAPQYNNNPQPPYGQQPYGQGAPVPPQYGQPPYGQQPPMPQINQSTYLVWAILTTLFCFLPLGIAAIVYATKINGFLMSGNFQMAQDSAKKSKTFSIIAACIGGGWMLIYMILMIIGVASMPY